MRLVSILTVLVQICLAMAVAAPLKEQAQPSSEAWLALIDTGKYAESWTEASARFRSAIPQEKWAEMAKKVRDDFGPLSSRKLLQVTLSNSLPGLPDGEYAIVQFNTAFQKKANAVETVTLTAEDDHWKVAGYFIR